MWLHAGVFHVLANMLSLLFIGIRLEQEFGFEDVLFSGGQRKEFIHRRWGSNFSFRHSIPFYRIKLLETEAERLFQFSITSVGRKRLFWISSTCRHGSMLSELTSNWTMYVNNHCLLSFSSSYLGFLFLICPQFKWLTQQNAPLGRVTTPVKSKHKTCQYVLWVLSLILLIVG
ncbi:hypothetical protein DVH24_032890 [Malus domestica]|uniref:RHOMBOID-like protein n=1 Tax=Malus domestica TaxID=3750 RepID=A0A498IMM7_MALDO|nr:hypothetical protein DVH24_032890 [Malus domestica]